ncbi:MAG: phytanoyl-CoA dioxygenase family protein [Microcoleaceae cyanobacterium]
MTATRLPESNQLPNSEIRTIRPLSKEQVQQYREEGFLQIPNFFDAEEIQPIQKAIAEDSSLGGSRTICTNKDGENFQVSIWTELEQTLLGIIPRMARIVDAAESLVGKECYHWHSKIVTKQPGEGGVDLHQDYASWYENGCIFPDLITCTIAIAASDRANGCLKVVKNSHLLGRLKRIGLNGKGAGGPEPERLAKILEKLPVVYCEMEPGDAVFFHANTLHGSDGNRSNSLRHLMHCSYNATDNEPFILEGQEHHRYRKLIKLSDAAIKNGDYNAVFKQQDFHPPETGDNKEGNIFYR